MRKALLGLLPVMLMMLALPALAEPYTFSNGAQWGMSKAEIAEIEKAEPDDDAPIREHVQAVIYGNQTVSKYMYLRTMNCFQFGMHVFLPMKIRT